MIAFKLTYRLLRLYGTIMLDMKFYRCFWLIALVAGCDCSSQPAVSCEFTSDCLAGWECVANLCVETEFDGGNQSLSCDAGPVCGEICCALGQVCIDNRCASDCGDRIRCNDICCESTQECLDNVCVAACADENNRCGESNELCCTEDQSCLNDSCVDLGEECTFTEECEVDEICEPLLQRCVPRDSVEVCTYMPPIGEFTPTIACQWRPETDDFERFDDVVMTPSVANLSDDNGDGATNTLDIPDLVFISFDKQRDNCCTPRGRVRIVSGLCNDDGTMDTLATIDSPFVGNSSGIALGNLHPDSMEAERAPEIVATFQGGGAIAWRRTADDGSAWEELWRNENDPAAAHSQAGAQPSLADVDGDGSPEVIIGNVVLNGLNGELRWDGRVTVGPTAGIGHNAFLGPTSTIADIDLDGEMEIIAGNTVYRGVDGMEEWTYEFVGDNSICQGSRECDGYNAIGNFDEDDFGEVVIVRRGEVFVLEHDGTEKHRIAIPWDDCTKRGHRGRANESGPPTVADFDGDGRPEIGTASADFYVVVDFDCQGDPLPAECESPNIRWTVPNEDCSSRATGSSVFDFSGRRRSR